MAARAQAPEFALGAGRAEDERRVATHLVINQVGPPPTGTFCRRLLALLAEEHP